MNESARVEKRMKLWDSLVTCFAVFSVAGIALLAWQGIVVWFELPKILLPTPGQVASAAWTRRNELMSAGGVTLWTAAVSLAFAIVFGSGVSILFSQSRLLRRAIFPYVVFLQTVPIVAIAPLLVTWSGYTFRTAVIATIIICLFPIINNVTSGLAASRREHNDLMQLYGATRLQRLMKLQIPTAIPFLVLGARISSGLAVIGAIVAEFFVSNGSDYNGLGALMTGWQGQMRTDALMAALAVSTILGLLLFGGVNFFSRLLLRRYLQVH